MIIILYVLIILLFLNIHIQGDIYLNSTYDDFITYVTINDIFTYDIALIINENDQININSFNLDDIGQSWLSYTILQSTDNPYTNGIYPITISIDCSELTIGNYTQILNISYNTTETLSYQVDIYIPADIIMNDDLVDSNYLIPSIDEGNDYITSWRLSNPPNNIADTIDLIITTESNEIMFPFGAMSITLSYDVTNWNISQNITITSLSDQITKESLRNIYLNYTVDTTADIYKDIDDSYKLIQIVEDDIASITSNFKDNISNIILEDDNSTIITLSLTSIPTDEVILNFNDNNLWSITPKTFIFNSTNWNNKNEFVLSSVDNNNLEGYKEMILNLNPIINITSNDLFYHNLTINDTSLIVIILDNDITQAIDTFEPNFIYQNLSIDQYIYISILSNLTISPIDGIIPSSFYCIFYDDHYDVYNTTKAMILSNNMLKCLIHANNDLTTLYLAIQVYHLIDQDQDIIQQISNIYEKSIEMMDIPIISTVEPLKVDIYQETAIIFSSNQFEVLSTKILASDISCLFDGRTSNKAAKWLNNSNSIQLQCYTPIRSEFNKQSSKVVTIELMFQAYSKLLLSNYQMNYIDEIYINSTNAWQIFWLIFYISIGFTMYIFYKLLDLSSLWYPKYAGWWRKLIKKKKQQKSTR